MQDFNCEYCGNRATQKRSQYKAKRHHFCSQRCYNLFRTDIMPPEEQNAWAGGVTPQESVRRWRAKNKKKIEAMQRARLNRVANAPGHHTQKQWEYIRDVIYQGRCAEEDETCSGPITKDHKVPLAMGGSEDPDNLEPLCKSHNSRKGIKVRLGVYNVPRNNEPVLPDTEAPQSRRQ